MLSGHIQGRVLSFISKTLKPKNILEIGTYTGYSALCLVEGIRKNGKLITIDKDKSLYDKVRYFFDKSEFSKQIIQKIKKDHCSQHNSQNNITLHHIDGTTNMQRGIKT